MKADELTAHEHALRAGALLAGIERTERHVDEASPEERLAWAASGMTARVNADLRWSAEVAIAEALTAIALQLTEPVERANGCTWEQ